MNLDGMSGLDEEFISVQLLYLRLSVHCLGNLNGYGICFKVVEDLYENTYCCRR